MNARSIALAVSSLAVCAAVVLAGDAPKATGGRAPHPHFNDGGTLSWSTKLAEAQKAANSGDRLIFIEYGREA